MNITCWLRRLLFGLCFSVVSSAYAEDYYWSKYLSGSGSRYTSSTAACRSEYPNPDVQFSMSSRIESSLDKAMCLWGVASGWSDSGNYVYKHTLACR